VKTSELQLQVSTRLNLTVSLDLFRLFYNKYSIGDRTSDRHVLT
jgi:hypothetical protein